MDDPVYEVLLEGGKVGPYDRRTIVGMRIKNALTSDHVLLASDGARLKVADLFSAAHRGAPFEANRSGVYSVVQATYAASLVRVRGRGYGIPAFKGEVEARVQTGVLRIAGRFRQGMGWKEDRVKLPLKEVVHTRVRGTIVDLWLRSGDAGEFLRVTLELFTPQAATAFVHWLPEATAWPEADSRPAPLAAPLKATPWVWGAVVAAVLAVGGVLITVLLHRPPH